MAGNPSLEALKARFGWGFKATWSNRRCPGHGRGVGNRLSFKGLSNPNHFMYSIYALKHSGCLQRLTQAHGDEKQLLLSVFSALLLGEVVGLLQRDGSNPYNKQVLPPS